MTNFDDIRPYNAEEIPAATQRLADSEVIPAIAQYLGVPAEALPLPPNVWPIAR